MAKFLSVSYDQTLLTTRQQILEREGHRVTSACGLQNALQTCDSNVSFDLLLVGHTLPHKDKEVLIKRFRAERPAARVIVLKSFGEQEVRGASLVIEPNPTELVDAVEKLDAAKGASA